MTSLIAFLFFAPVDLTIPVGVEAAYVISTHQSVPVQRCCGLCAGGKIIHGDGHVTDCPCPVTCECKKNPALIHPPSVLKCAPKK